MKKHTNVKQIELKNRDLNTSLIKIFVLRNVQNKVAKNGNLKKEHKL